MSDDEHRDLGSVFTLIPDLFRNEIVLQKTLDLSGPQRPPLLSFLEGILETILVKERRICEAREDGEEPRVPPLAIDGSLSDEFWREPSDTFPILQVVDVDLVFYLSPSINRYFCFELGEKSAHISLVYNDEMILDQHPDFEFRILLFGDQILSLEIWVRNVDRDDFFSGRVLIGYQVEECAIVSDALCKKKKKQLEYGINQVCRARRTDMS